MSEAQEFLIDSKATHKGLTVLTSQSVGLVVTPPSLLRYSQESIFILSEREYEEKVSYPNL